MTELLALTGLIAWMLPATHAAWPALASQAAVPPAERRSIAVVVLTPAPVDFELALDEIELEWHKGEGEPRTALPGTSVISHDGGHTALAVAADGIDRLREVLRAEEQANPGSSAHVVLYEAGRPRTASSRRLLTPEIAVVIASGVSIDDVAARAALLAGEMVPGVEGAYVLRAPGALAALDAVRQLAVVPGVTTVYSLLKRTLVMR